MNNQLQNNAKLFAQVMAGLNAAYLLVVGLMSVVAPVVANKLYGDPDLNSLSSALTRILGSGMIGAGLFLAMFAWKPEKYSQITRLLLFQAVVNTVGFFVVGMLGELQWSQIGRSLVAQGLLAVSLAFYLAPRNR